MEEILTNKEYDEFLEKFTHLATEHLDSKQLGYLCNVSAFIFITKYNITKEEFYKIFKETTNKMLNKYMEENSVEGE